MLHIKGCMVISNLVTSLVPYFMCALEGLVERTVAESIGVTFVKADLYFVALSSQKSLKHTQYEVLQT